MRSLGLLVLSIPLLCCYNSAQEVQQPDNGLSSTDASEFNEQEEHFTTPSKASVPADEVVNIYDRDDDVNTISDVVEQTDSLTVVSPESAPTSVEDESVESDVDWNAQKSEDQDIAGDLLDHLPKSHTSDDIDKSDHSEVLHEEKEADEVTSSSPSDEFPNPVDFQTLDTTNIEKVSKFNTFTKYLFADWPIDIIINIIESNLISTRLQVQCI